MNEWLLLLLATTIGSVISLVGGLYLIYGKRGVHRLQRLSVPFAAGALLAAAFLDLLPEAFEAADVYQILLATLVGFLLFFILEQSLSWFHHHESKDHTHTKHSVWLIVIGDTMHNFIDGLAIGASFIVNPVTGFVTTLAVAFHEIPRELGDFGLMLDKGMARPRIVLMQLIGAAATVLGAVLVYGFGDQVHLSEPLLLAATAGFFIYIAASDIIPEIHAQASRRSANIQTVVLLFGVLFVGLLSYWVHHSFGA